MPVFAAGAVVTLTAALILDAAGCVRAVSTALAAAALVLLALAVAFPRWPRR